MALRRHFSQNFLADLSRPDAGSAVGVQFRVRIDVADRSGAIRLSHVYVGQQSIDDRSIGRKCLGAFGGHL